MLTKEVRQHGGNLGYDDSAAEYYSWDDTVPNYAEPKIKDKIVIWDGETLIGSSVIQDIKIGSSEKPRLRCPHCNMTKIKPRKNSSPKYRCHNPNCRKEFEYPTKDLISVTTYRSYHADFWYDLYGELDGDILRALCEKPKSIHSLRPLKWDNFIKNISKDFSHNSENIEKLESDASGHKIRKTRVRVGQSKFRKEMLNQFGEICALSGLSHLNGLDAAHLYSYAAIGEHHYNGGLLLRKDLHKLFDLGLIAINVSSMKIILASSLQKIGQYKDLHGSTLKVQISKETKMHWEEHNTSLTFR
jgi:hypothetical protein